MQSSTVPAIANKCTVWIRVVLTLNTVLALLPEEVWETDKERDIRIRAQRWNSGSIEDIVKGVQSTRRR